MLNDFQCHDLQWPIYRSEDIVKLRERWNLTQSQLGDLLGVSRKSIIRWETTAENLPCTVRIALCVLDKLGEDVFKLMDKGIKRFTLCPIDNEKDEPPRLSPLDLPHEFDGETIKALRQRLRLSQKDFADLLGISLSTVTKWELGAVSPKGPALMILKILWRDGKDTLPQ